MQPPVALVSPLPDRSGLTVLAAQQLASGPVPFAMVPGCFDGARTALATAGIKNVTVVLGDCALGHAEHAPYDRIIATVGAHGIPPAWLEQLGPGGRLLTPLRLHGSVSRSIAWERRGDTWQSVHSAMNTFMPLRRGIADDPRRIISLTRLVTEFSPAGRLRPLPGRFGPQDL